jgi:hypothetical protein
MLMRFCACTLGSAYALTRDTLSWCVAASEHICVLVHAVFMLCTSRVLTVCRGMLSVVGGCGLQGLVIACLRRLLMWLDSRSWFDICPCLEVRTKGIILQLALTVP